MATVVERRLPGYGRRMLVIGISGLLLGGLAGGLAGVTLRSDEADRASIESAPAISSAPVTDIEGLRAQSFAVRAPAPVTDIEALRAQSFGGAKG
jgi:hypothetical protein